MTDLPPGWVIAPLGELVDVLDNMRVPVSAKERASRTGHVPYYGATGQVGYIDSHIFDEDLVLLGEDGVQFFDPNKPKAYTISGPAWVNNHAHVLRAQPSIGRQYLYHYLNHFNYRGYANGTTRLKLTQAAMVKIPILLPPLAEQRRIVATLEDHLSRLDAAVALVVTSAKRTSTLRKSCIDSAARGTLTHSLTAVDPLGCLSEVEGKDETRFSYSALPALPSGWKWRTAKEVCSSIVCGSTPPAQLMHPGKGDIPFLKVYNITSNGTIDFSIRPTFVDRSTHNGALRRSRVEPGDVLTNIVGPPLGKTAVVPNSHGEWNINQAIVSFRAGPSITPAWLALTLQSPLILGLLQKTARATAGQFNIALSTCRELPLPVPPITEQKKITATLDRLLSHIAAAGILSSHLATAEQLRNSVLREAFAGRLVAQDPNDEPASELLARIRAERAASIPKQRTRASRTRKELPAPPTRVTGDNYQQGELPL
ncbi:restriction endonuclease subunit S [Micromonospora sp. NPDC003197]